MALWSSQNNGASTTPAAVVAALGAASEAQRTAAGGCAVPLSGLTADGATDDKAAIIALAGAGRKKVFLNGATAVWSGYGLLPNDCEIVGPGQIRFADESSEMRLGARNRVSGVTFVGTLTSTTGFSLHTNGVQASFATPTYQDYAAATVDGADFTHTLAGSVLTVGLPSALTAQLGRMVVGSAITLDPAKRYSIWIDDGFVSGDGAAPVQFWKCAADGTEIEAYNPAASLLSVFLFLEGAAALKVKVGSARHNHTKLNLSCSFDLSKIRIYELVNDLASMSTAASPENLGHVTCYSEGSTVTRCRFERMTKAPVKLVNAKACRITHNQVEWSTCGITSQGSKKNRITHNDINVSLLDAAGERVPVGIAWRGHCIGVGSAENGLVVAHNTCAGASWAIENASGAQNSIGVRILHNDIDAVHCGISAAAEKGAVSKNSITLSSLGLYGIEVPVAPYASVSGNDVYQDSPALLSYGIASSLDCTGMTISNNTVRANVGIQLVITSGNADKKIKITKNHLDFWTGAIYSSAGGTEVTANTGRCLGLASGRGTGPSAAIQIESVFHPSRIRKNVIDGAGAYGIYVVQPQVTEIVDNEVTSPTPNYADVLIHGAAGYPAYPVLLGNRVQGRAYTSHMFAVSGAINAASVVTIGGNVGSQNQANWDIYQITNLASTFLRSKTPYIDQADGALKFLFDNGTVKTLATNA